MSKVCQVIVNIPSNLKLIGQTVDMKLHYLSCYCPIEYHKKINLSQWIKSGHSYGAPILYVRLANLISQVRINKQIKDFEIGPNGDSYK